MPAATAEMSERPNACPECAQHGGREYGHLERYMKVYKVRNLRYSKSGRNPVHLGLDPAVAASFEDDGFDDAAGGLTPGF